MEQQVNHPMLDSQPLHLVGIVQILGNALGIPGKTRKVMISYVLLVLVPFCLFALSTDQLLKPTLVDILLNISLLDKENPSSLETKEALEEILMSAWLLLVLEMVFLLFFCIVAVLSLVAMVYTTSGKEFDLKELLSRTWVFWKRPMITWLYATFMFVIVVAVILVSIGVLSVSPASLSLIVLSIMLVILGTLGHLCLGAILMLSVVTCTVDEYINGVIIVRRSEEIIMGRRLQGFVLMLITSLVNAVINVALAWKARKINKRNEDSRLEIGIVVVCLGFLLKFFMSLLYTVFYYEYKMKHGEQVEGEERSGYARIATGDV